ncbi:flavin-containing monooxygenase FMO GS-OX5-like [Contarinia nasturtii]|uniref:flavin-containing monooxygenase FMO GS-OX5-like n=1 Tax=Contarinia nasturtii TaxID=265458 RepID=UPI0012D4322A|nr:flavin-containing monooxygenase FMO GS-OX5-like [Contarinia nasturtii]XP_031621425.1 flavin-containing monooxygenase FMO GS-OX5-like [Contarinia nasturtii]XP_031621426.1 flavin-containing monooxygenase FMO GS-OX5-like [Contarinia nasturtii]
MAKLNVAIVGAGLAGLCAAKYAKYSGHTVTVFEQCNEIGGTWIYRESIGVDEYGLNIHTSMYHNLRTNLPKEIMGFRDFPMPSSSSSYISSNEVLSYLISYAEHFKLNELIKFKHHVIQVRPFETTKWKISVKNLPTNNIETYVFDAVFVCNGHNCVPSQPHFEGLNEFQGHHMHSHNYRRAEAFKDKTVVIIGAGPSGIDLCNAISKCAKTVVFSHHTHNPNHVYPSNVVRKGSVQRFTKNGAVFADGSEIDITDIVFCTGYEFTMPFASDECGLLIDNNYVFPLYKHCINAIHPTMAVIGYVFHSAITHMIEIQVRFFMQYLNGNATLPPQEEMLADSTNQLKKRLALGWPKKNGHSIAGPLQREYFNDLSATANIENVREIFLKIFEDCGARRSADPVNYRLDVYKIIDVEHFERSSLVPHSN